jgi:hypothetical protein
VEELVMVDPMTSVRIYGLGPMVNNAVALIAHQRSDGSVGDEAAYQVAMVTVENDFVADLGEVTGLVEAAA